MYGRQGAGWPGGPAGAAAGRGCGRVQFPRGSPAPSLLRVAAVRAVARNNLPRGGRELRGGLRWGRTSPLYDLQGSSKLPSFLSLRFLSADVYNCNQEVTEI